MYSKNKSTRYLFIVFLLLTLVYPSLAFGKLLYVSPAGDDAANNCEAEGDPCLTVPYVIGLSTTGDEIRFSDGTYVVNQQITIINKSVTLKAVNKHKAVIQISGTHGFQIVNSHQGIPMVFDGLRIEATGDVCASLVTNSFVHYRNLYVTSTSRGIFISHGRGFITKSVFVKNSNEAILINNQADASVKFTIHRNIFAHNGKDIMIQNTAKNSLGTITRNLFVATQGWPFTTTSNDLNQGERYQSSFLFANNTVTAANGPGWEPDNGEGFYLNNVVVNNYFGAVYDQNVKARGLQEWQYNLGWNNPVYHLGEANFNQQANPAYQDTDSGTVTSVEVNKIFDTGKGWAPGALVGEFVNPDITDKKKWFYIVANTATSLTVAAGDMTQLTSPTKNYAITDFKTLTPGVSAAINSGHPLGRWSDLNGSRNDRGWTGGPDNAIPFTTFKTDSKFITAQVNQQNVPLNELLINNAHSTPVVFNWQQVAGPAITLNPNNASIALIEQAPANQSNILIKATVTDDAGNSFETMHPLTVAVNTGFRINDQGGYLPTLTSALAIAQPGDDIIVYPGIYHVITDIDKTVTIKGISRTSAVFDGHKSQAFSSNGPKNAIMHVTAPGVRIDNITIQNSGGPGIDVDVAVDPNFLFQFSITNSLVQDSSKSGLTGSGNGRFEIHNNEFLFNDKHGISIRGEQGATIQKNKFLGNGEIGINQQPGSTGPVNINNNIIAGNTKPANGIVNGFTNNIIMGPEGFNFLPHMSNDPQKPNGLKILNNFIGTTQSMTLGGPTGSRVDIFNNVILNHPSPTLINCQQGGVHNTTYRVDNNTFFGTPGNPAAACQHGEQDKVENPNYETILNSTITGSSANSITKGDANWDVNAFTGLPIIIKNALYLVKENTGTTIKVYVPKNKPQYSLDNKNLNPGEPFTIINPVQKNNDSPLYNTGHTQFFSKRDRRNISRFSFGRADRGPFELAQEGVFMLPKHNPIVVVEGGMINVKLGLMSQPQDSVTVNLTGDEELGINPQVLNFQLANWIQDKNIQISALQNDVVDGDRVKNITVVGTSNDAKYNKSYPNYVLTIQDDDKAPVKPDDQEKIGLVIVNETNGKTVVSKNGQTDTYSIHLEQKPSSVVDIVAKPSPQLSLDKHKLRFNRLNWNAPQFITVSALKIPKELPSQDEGNGGNVEQQNQTPQERIVHKAISMDPAYSDIKIKKVFVDVIFDDNSVDGKDSANKPKITITDTQCVEKVETKLYAIVSGELNYPQYKWKHLSGPKFTMGEMEIRSIGDSKAKLMIEATAPKFDPADHRTFMKFIITDGNETYDATIMINILPEETELSKNNVQKIQGKVLGINSNGELMNELEESSFSDDRRFIMLTDDVKLYIGDNSEPQLLSFDDYVIFSDYSFDFNRGVIVSFNLTKLTRKDYDLNTLTNLKNPGVHSFKGAYEDDMLGYKIANGDVDGNGSQEVWALAPFGNNAAAIYIFSAGSLNPIRRFYESEVSKFSTLFNVADINGDQKADFNTATVYTTQSYVPEAYKNDDGQFLGADRLLSYLSQDNMGTRISIDECQLDHMINPQNRNDIQNYDGHPGNNYLKTQYAVAEGEDDSFIELTVSLDMNDDGSDDLALAASDLVVSVYFGSDDIEDMEELSIDLSEFITGIFSMAVGDVTGDGLDDIVLGCNDGIIIIIPGNANLPYDATLTTDDIIVVQTESTDDIDTLYVGDTNGDGVAEIAFYDDDEDVTNLIDTFNDFAGTTNDPASTSGPTGYQLGGASGCSLNQNDLTILQASQDYLTALLLLLSLILLRVNKHALREKIRMQTIMIKGKKHAIMIKKF
jgi:hypothetical protein